MKHDAKMSTIQKFLSCFCVVALMLLYTVAVRADDPGTDSENVGPSPVTLESIDPVVTETGNISLSVDGLGSNAASGIIQVNKPAGATVRKAYMAAASTGFSNRVLADGDVKIDGTDVNWDMTESSSISSRNHWADVTDIVKPTIDAAAAGMVDFTITEVNTFGIDGEILAVIFDDPNQMTTNTIVLLFGAQDINGDTFAIGLADPIDKSDPDLVLDLSLGISFGFQPSGQRSEIDVNGTRMTSSAGGQDDGASANGALLTVGGIGDTNDNPDPNVTDSGGPRTDDELYNLLPFVNDGDTNISVFTINPSDDDNIFFAALFLGSTTAVVGEGILLTPDNAVNDLNTQHTVTAKVQDDNGEPVEGKEVTFTIVSGPHAGLTDTDTTDSNGEATFTYTGTTAGTDVIEASFVDSNQETVTSNQVTKTWEEPTAIELKSFKARAGADGSVIITWETATEVDNAGFNVYRARSEGGQYTKINGTLIAAKGSATAGARYRYVDKPGEGKFYYMLEDVDSNGKATLHGPASNKMKRSRR